MPLNKLSVRKYLFSIILILIVLLVGSFLAYRAYQNSSNEQNQNILAKVNTITRGISLDEVGKLSATKDDLNLKEYQTLKDRLIDIRRANTDIRFIYLMTERDNKIVFMVDSEPSDSKDYSPPGEVYTEAEPEIYETFRRGGTILEPVSSDRWGTWVSGLAKMYDKNGNQNIVVGIDIDASSYLKEPWIKTLPFIFLTLLVLTLGIAEFVVRRKELELIENKSQFISIASHELRSPLTGIRWASEILLEDKTLSKDNNHMVVGIKDSCLRLLSIVNDLLDLSTVEKKLVDSKKFTRVDMEVVISESLKGLQEVILQKKISFEIRKPSNNPCLVYGDSIRLTNVFTNLLSNSFKYSPDSSPVEVIIDTTLPKQVQITVQDHGIGIPKQDTKKVLNGFYRSQNAQKYSVMGTGIGLYVSTKIVEAHKGSLNIESEEGKGTKVIVKLPLIN